MDAVSLSSDGFVRAWYAIVILVGVSAEGFSLEERVFQGDVVPLCFLGGVKKYEGEFLSRRIDRSNALPAGGRDKARARRNVFGDLLANIVVLVSDGSAFIRE